MKKMKGITLISLVITIIILIILAGVGINLTIGENGMLKKAKESKEQHSEQEAREKLEIVLVNAEIEKQTNIAYNSGEYLDFMLEAKGITIDENIATINNYNFLIDRENLIILENLGETQIKLTTTIQEYLGKNENNKHKVNLLLAIESNSTLKSIVIQNPDGTTFEMKTEDIQLGEDMIVELDEKYIVKVITADGKIETRNIVINKEDVIVEEYVALEKSTYYKVNNNSPYVIYVNTTKNLLTYGECNIKLKQIYLKVNVGNSGAIYASTVTVNLYGYTEDNWELLKTYKVNRERYNGNKAVCNTNVNFENNEKMYTDFYVSIHSTDNETFAQIEMQPKGYIYTKLD